MARKTQCLTGGVLSLLCGIAVIIIGYKVKPNDDVPEDARQRNRMICVAAGIGFIVFGIITIPIGIYNGVMRCRKRREREREQENETVLMGRSDRFQPGASNNAENTPLNPNNSAAPATTQPSAPAVAPPTVSPPSAPAAPPSAPPPPADDALPSYAEVMKGGYNQFPNT